jgi:hypothetical protein
MKQAKSRAGGWAFLLAALMSVSGLAYGDKVCLGSPGSQQGAGARFLEQQVAVVDAAARDAYQELPFEEFRVAEAQHVLGSDPRVLFAWVRDETRWLPYEGLLRGPDGVMLDRMGSSLDRAMLLATWLEKAGHEARLARAELTDDGLSALHQAWSQQPVAIRPQRDLDDDQERTAIMEVAQRHGLAADLLEAQYRQQDQEVEQARQRLLEQVQIQQAALQDALGHVLGGADPAAGSAGQVAEHWWVEWRAPEGWNSLDPALPGHVAGDLLVAGEDVAYYYPEALPDEVYHWLTIQVVAEQFDGSRLQEHLALEHRVPAAALHGRQLHLETYPLGLPSQQQLLDGGEVLATLPSKLLENTQWVPYLRIGDSLERQHIIHVDGSVEDPSQQTMTGAAFGEAASALGGISVGGRRAEERPEPELTAVFARFSVTAPGRDTDTFERPMMDLLGPGQRQHGVQALELDDSLREQRAAALLGTFELLAQSSWLPPSQQAAWRYETLLDNRQASFGTAYAATHGDFSFMGDTLEARSLRRGELDRLAGLRLAFSPQLERIALTRLNLLGYVSLVEYRDGQLRRREGFDILDNRVDVPSGDAVASTRLAQGVLDTLLEVELLAGAQAPLSNAASAYGNDLDRQNHWQVIEHGNALNELGWQPDGDLLVHFEGVLADGKTLVMPAALPGGSVPTWWQLDPVSGDLLGYGPDRRGQFVEAILMLLSAGDNAMGAVQMVQLIWDCLLTSDDPHCCTRTAAANQAIGKMAGKGLAAAAHAQRVNLVIGRSIVHGRTFRKLNEAAVGKVAGHAGGVIAGAATSAVGCS